MDGLARLGIFGENYIVVLSHPLDAVTGINVGYALEVRVTSIPVVPVQLKPYWRDCIALIRWYNLQMRPFSKLMTKQTLCPNGQHSVLLYCGS